MSEKQKAFIVSVIKIFIAIMLAGIAGGRFFGKEMTVLQYIILSSTTAFIFLFGFFIQK